VFEVAVAGASADSTHSRCHDDPPTIRGCDQCRRIVDASPRLNLTVGAVGPVMLQPVPQEQVRPLTICGLPLKVSVIERFCTAPPPMFVTVPDIVYVTVPFETFATGFSARLRRLDRAGVEGAEQDRLIAAVLGLLPEVMLANRTLLSRERCRRKFVLRSNPALLERNAGLRRQEIRQSLARSR